MSIPVWTARCRSGYLIRNKAGRLSPCSRLTPRYQLMCDDCKSAETQPAAPPTETNWGLAWFCTALASVINLAAVLIFLEVI